MTDPCQSDTKLPLSSAFTQSQAPAWLHTGKPAYGVAVSLVGARTCDAAGNDALLSLYGLPAGLADHLSFCFPLLPSLPLLTLTCVRVVLALPLPLLHHTLLVTSNGLLLLQIQGVREWCWRIICGVSAHTDAL